MAWSAIGATSATAARPPTSPTRPRRCAQASSVRQPQGHQHRPRGRGEQQLAEPVVEVGVLGDRDQRERRHLRDHQRQPGGPGRVERASAGPRRHRRPQPDREQPLEEQGELGDEVERHVEVAGAVVVAEARRLPHRLHQQGRVREDVRVDQRQQRGGRGDAGQRLAEGRADAAAGADEEHAAGQQGRGHQDGRRHRGAGPHHERDAGDEPGDAQQPSAGRRGDHRDQGQRHQRVAGGDGDVLDVEHQVAGPHRQREQGRGRDHGPAPGARAGSG